MIFHCIFNIISVLLTMTDDLIGDDPHPFGPYKPNPVTRIVPARDDPTKKNYHVGHMTISGVCNRPGENLPCEHRARNNREGKYIMINADEIHKLFDVEGVAVPNHFKKKLIYNCS